MTFTVSSYSLSVVFYQTTKTEQNQNMSCYIFIILLVWNKNTWKIVFLWPLLSLMLRDLRIIDMVKSCSNFLNFYHLWKTDAVTFFHLFCLCLQRYIPWSSNTIKIKSSMSQWYPIKFFKTDLNLRIRSTR